MDLLTVTDVCGLLRVPPSWVYARTCGMEGFEQIPHLKLGRHLRFRRGEVLAWVERHHRGGEPSGSQPDGALQPKEKESLSAAC